MLLCAAADGVSASFFNQTLEIAALRARAAAAAGIDGRPQLLLRLGYGGKLPATPRRALEGEATRPRAVRSRYGVGSVATPMRARLGRAMLASSEEVDDVDRQGLPVRGHGPLGGGGVTRASVPGKAVVHVAAPPEFRGGALGFWSPEERPARRSGCVLLRLTLEAIAERRELTLESVGVHGTGHVTKRDDGRFGFVAIELIVRLETDAADVAAAEKAARDAERACLVAMALDVPAHVAVTVQAAAGAVR